MRIGFLGDTAFYGKNTIDNPNCIYMFNEIKPYLDSCDYIIANLEAPFTNENQTVGGKSAYLKSNPKNVEILKYLGVTHVTLANNHMYDYRSKGLNDTIKVLDDNKIDWYGVNDRNAIIKDKDSKIVLMGYCCFSTNGKGLGYKKPFINVLNPFIIEDQLRIADKKGFLPILSLHWGQEHVHYPNYDHVELGRKLSKEHRIIIHGHHPHVIQGIEMIDRSLISYSLGNFCFDDVYTNKSKYPLVKLSNDNKESFILIVDIINNEILSYEIVPFSFSNGEYIVNYSINEKIKEWTDFLNTEKELYIRKRERELNQYIKKRKELRDFNWYIKRMNIDSIKMIINSRNNMGKYNKTIRQFIK